MTHLHYLGCIVSNCFKVSFIVYWIFFSILGMPSNQYRNRCCILLCKAHLPKSHHTTTDTRLHRFPSNGKQRQKWCTEIQEKGHQKIQKSHSKVLCSQHFKVDDYVKRKDPTKKQPHILKSGAIPSIFPLSQSLERVDLHHSFHSSDVSRNDEEFLIGVVDCNGKYYNNTIITNLQLNLNKI